MDPVNKERVNQFYNDGLKKFGYDIKALASGVEERRKIRFKILSEAGLTSGCSVLDLGCGFGDFYGYLRERAISVQYIGYDINPNLIEVAKQVYPEAEFHVKDIQAEPFPHFDYIVSTSAFNHPLVEQDQYQFAQDILTICYNHARQGVAIDFLTSYVDFKSPILFHYSPERMFSIAKKITKRVCLRHDYPLFDFCIYLYPDFTGWQNEKNR
jgi:SAM-dependent methyltransferase